jgi:hypothetical protein
MIERDYMNVSRKKPTARSRSGHTRGAAHFPAPYEIPSETWSKKATARVMLNGGLSFGARVLYWTLSVYAGTSKECWPSQKRLARDLGIRSTRGVRKYEAELFGAGLIDVLHRLGKTSVYTLHVRPKPRRREPDLGTSVPGSAE